MTSYKYEGDRFDFATDPLVPAVTRNSLMGSTDIRPGGVVIDKANRTIVAHTADGSLAQVIAGAFNEKENK